MHIQVKLGNIRHLMGYVNYFLLTQKRSIIWLFNARHVFSGRHLGGLCQQTRFIVPVESACANRVPIVPEDSWSHRHRVVAIVRASTAVVLGYDPCLFSYSQLKRLSGIFHSIFCFNGLKSVSVCTRRSQIYVQKTQNFVTIITPKRLACHMKSWLCQ